MHTDYRFLTIFAMGAVALILGFIVLGLAL
jgi:hypothetical protein